MPPVRPQVLNDVFQQAADQARQKLPNLTHNQQVCILYLCVQRAYINRRSVCRFLLVVIVALLL